MSEPYVWIDPFEDREAEVAYARRRGFEDGYRHGLYDGSTTRTDYRAARRSVAIDIRAYKSELHFSKDAQGLMYEIAMEACAIIAERAPRQ